ncbi:MAG TPA: tyrosine-type recombinase/integrase, partial [Microbacteriaceae bacterium]|nr:tyrosine-type recombinase/integrase [Microbacteriaceae bacterium]
MNLLDAIAQFRAHLEKERAVSPHTVRGYLLDLDQFATFAAAHRVTATEDVSAELCREWLWSLSESGGARSSAARRLATLKSFGRWGERIGLWERTPAARLARPRPERTLPRVLTREQMRDILDQASRLADSGDPVAIRNAAILELLYASAIRVSELVGANLDAIDRERNTIRVWGKGSKERIVPFGVFARRALDRYLDDARPLLARGAHLDALWLGARGGRLSERAAYAVVSNALEAFPGSGPHGPHV